MKKTLSILLPSCVLMPWRRECGRRIKIRLD
jgi:hypothetical protein